MFKKCFQSINFALQCLYKHDTLPLSATDKPQKIDAKVARADFLERFEGFSHIGDSIFAAALSGYKEHRNAIFWNGQQNFLTYRKGYPIPIRDGKWEPVLVDNKDYLIRIVFAREPGSAKKGAQQLTLKLVSGDNYSSHKANFKRLVDQTVPLNERVIPLNLRLIAEPARNRPFSASTLSVALTVDAPKNTAYTSTHRGVLYLETGKDYLLAARVNNRRIWTISGDQYPKFLFGLRNQLADLNKMTKHYDYKLDRVRSDTKFEDRCEGSKSGTQQTRQILVKRHNNKVNSLLHEVTTRVANFGDRHCGGFEKVVLDDRVKGWPKHFPFFKMINTLGYKFNARNIKFVDENDNDRLQPNYLRKQEQREKEEEAKLALVADLPPTKKATAHGDKTRRRTAARTNRPQPN